MNILSVTQGNSVGPWHTATTFFACHVERFWHPQLLGSGAYSLDSRPYVVSSY